MRSKGVIDIKKMVTFTVVGALLLAIVFAALGLPASRAQNALSGAVVGAIAGVLICMAICVLGRSLSSPDPVADYRPSVAANAIVGGYVGLIIVSVLTTITFTLVGVFNHLPNPFLWGTLVSALVGWIAGAFLGVLIGATWEKA
jgi:hypothetical protein